MSRWDDDAEEGMGRLVGKRIDRIEVSAGGKYLSFITDKGGIAYSAEGDCCSTSWFNHISGVDALLGHTVTSQVYVALGEVKPDKRRKRDHECIKLYSIKLVTDAGRADIEFRNSSNGYYGGYLEKADAEYLPKNMQQVTDDWSA